MNYTENLGLKLPEAGDSYNIEDMNYNSLIIEEELKPLIENIGQYNIPTVVNEPYENKEINKFYIDDLKVLNTNQRVLLATPNYDNTNIIKNYLNDKEIDTILEPNNLYELFYKDEKFFNREYIKNFKFEKTLTQAVSEIQLPTIPDGFYMFYFKGAYADGPNTSSNSSTLQLFGNTVFSVSKTSTSKMCLFYKYGNYLFTITGDINSDRKITSITKNTINIYSTTQTIIVGSKFLIQGI